MRQRLTLCVTRRSLVTSKSFVHDPNGNVTERADFNNDNIVYEYDENNRLLKKTYPDDSEVSFTYTPTGQRETVTDVRGTTAYVYDLRDRLKEVTNPDNTKISYT
ncbi:RHS repeat domain-containing protein [Desulfonema magnum]|nr:RHS repeat domain-containing protein [Desulfonema magnum]